MKRKSLLISVFMFSTQLYALSPLGMTIPYNLNLMPERPHQNGKLQTTLFVEKSYNIKGFDIDGTEKNVLQIFDETQNVLGLYSSGDTGVTATDVTTAIGGGADTKNGLYSVTGNYYATQCAFTGTYSFGQGFMVRAVVPVFSISLSNVVWDYAGNKASFAGAAMSSVFTTFKEEAKTLFDLNVTGWSKTGIGDTALLLDWQRDFPQYKKLLKNVRPILRLGVTLPTGAQNSEQDFASTSFGADGSVTIPFGGGLHADLGDFFQVGFDAQFWYIWGKTKKRRIKTSFYQTELLLPTIANTAKQHGIFQHFSLKGAVFSRNRAYNLRWFYEYMRKGEDIITPVDAKYGYDVINDHSESAAREQKGQKSLDEFTAHAVTVKVGYDHHYVDPNLKVVPQGYLFLRMGFNGSYSHVASTVGVQLSLDF